MTTQPVLRINLQEGDPLSLHPHQSVEVRCLALQKALFEGLTRNNEKDQIELAAAEKVEVSPEQTVYTFTLRPHLWSNGKPVTAYHFENAWKKALSPTEICFRPEFFYVIKNARAAKLGTLPLDQVGLKAIDERTLRVELEHPAPYFLNLVSNPMFSPLFDHEKEPKVFNGPFLLKTWQRNVALELISNPGY
ncbi:MAG: ABC transporter substrate-binding protein, partial [Anaerolineae bacterium]